MSVCGQSGQTEEDSASEEVAATVREKVSDTYKQKPASKVVRVLTVLAYLLSVSLAAILLSVYYICVWKSPDLPLSEPELPSARRGNFSDYQPKQYADQPYNVTGGGDTPMNTTSTTTTVHPTPENITAAITPGNVSDSTTDTALNITDLLDTTTPGLLNGTSDDIGSINDVDNVT